MAPLWLTWASGWETGVVYGMTCSFSARAAPAKRVRMGSWISRRPAGEFTGGAGISPAGQVDEVQVLDGLGGRNTVERPDIVVPDGDRPGRAVGGGVVDLGGDVSRRSGPFLGCGPVVEVGQDEAGARVLGADLGDLADLAGDDGSRAFG